MDHVIVVTVYIPRAVMSRGLKVNGLLLILSTYSKLYYFHTGAYDPWIYQNSH